MIRHPLRIVALLCLSVSLATAQNIFKGGVASGFGTNSATSISLGPNIFKGGAGSVYGYSQSVGAFVGVNIFKSGAGDGYSKSTSALAIGANIFEGGDDAGYAKSSSEAVEVGVNIFAGGEGSGYTYSFAASALGGRLKVEAPSVINVAASVLPNGKHLVSITFGDALENIIIYKQSGDADRVADSNPIQKSDSDWHAIIDPGTDQHHQYQVEANDSHGRKVYSEIVTIWSNEKMFQIFPNPVNDLLNIKLLDNEPATIIMSDVTSNNVISAEFANETFINTGHLPSGFYIIRIVTASGRHSIKKIIVEH